MEGKRKYRHHSTRTRSRHEHLATIGPVLANRPCHHVGNGVTVSTAIVCQRCLRTHVPAAAGVWAGRVDHDEAVLLGEGGVGGVAVVAGAGAGAYAMISIVVYIAEKWGNAQ